MIELSQHRGLNSKRFDTGKKENGLPVYGESIQNGLHYKKNGLLLPVDTTVFAQNDYEFTHKVDKARVILRFGDSSANAKKHLFGIEDDAGNWLNGKIDRAGHDMSGIQGNKPTFPHADGITVEHIPTYKGVKTNYRLGSSGINEITVTFKYNPELIPEQRGNTIVFVRDGKDIFIVAAPFAYDALGSVGHVEPVAMMLAEIGGFTAAILTVDSLWAAGALDPVIDPSVSIDDDTGTFEDANISSVPGQEDYNWGGQVFNQHYNGVLAFSNNAAYYVDLSAYVGVTVTLAKYTFNCIVRSGAAFTVTVNPILRPWGEGNKSSSAASAGEITGNSSQHGTQLWTGVICTGSGTDYNATAAAIFTSPAATGLFDVVLTNTSLQSKIDGTNYGDIFRVPLTNTGAYYRDDSSESVGTKPVLYFEYTAGAAWHPFFFDGGHY